MKKNYYKDDTGNFYKEVIVNKHSLIFYKNGDKVEILNIENLTKINKPTYNNLKCTYWKNVKETWVYQGVQYKNLNCFENTEDFFHLPRHEFVSINDGYRLVYHQGFVYCCVYYYSSKSNVLLKNKEGKIVKRTTIYNCAPIFNCETKQII